jgi:hypothetical protein
MTSVTTDRRLGVNASIAVKAPCQAVATTPITLSGLQTIGGVVLAEHDRVLVTAQTDAKTNGIYDVGTAGWTRSLDFDGDYDAAQGTIVTIASAAGTSILYTLTSADPIIFGTSAITFLATDMAGNAGLYAAQAQAAATSAANSQITATQAAATASAAASTASTAQANATTSAASAQASASAAASYLAPVSGTSTTSMSISTGSKSFTTQTGLSFVPGNPILIVETAAPTTNTMSGTCVSYVPSTGAMVVAVNTITGSGTYSDWTISLTTTVGNVPGVIKVVSALPSAGSSYQGQVVYLTTDGKLYRFDGSNWVAWISASDIAGTLQAAQIASLTASQITGQLTDAQLQAIAAAKVSGQLTDAQLASIAAAKVSGASWTGSQIAAGTITAGNIAAQTITGTQIAGQTISAANIASGTITAGQIAAATITGTQIAAGTIQSANIAAGTIQADRIAAATITGDRIAANTITSKNLIVADFTNLVVNGTFSTGDLSNWNRFYGNVSVALAVPGIGNCVRLVTNASVETSLTNGLYDFSVDTNLLGGFPVKAGDPLYMQIDVAGPPSSSKVFYELLTRDVYGNPYGSVMYVLCGNADAAWHTYSIAGVANVTGRAYVRLGAYPGSSVTGETFYATNFICMRRANANLIVDGAITASKIAAAAVTADKISTGSLSAISSNLGSITAGSMNIGSGKFTVDAAGNLTATGAVVSGTVTASAVVAGSVTTNGIALNAVSDVQGKTFNGSRIVTQNNGAGTWNDFSGDLYAPSINADGTSSYTVIASLMKWYLQFNDTSPHGGQIAIFDNGSPIAAATIDIAWIGNTLSNVLMPLSTWQLNLVPTAGSHVFSIWWANSAAFEKITLNKGSITVLGLKR